MTETEKALVETLHERACASNAEHYRDPVTGYLVFTRLKHLRRGYCCKSACRHCPYGFNPTSAEHRQ